MSAITPNLLESIFPEGWQSPVENLFPFLPTSGGIVQIQYKNIDKDTTTGSAVPVDLLSISLTNLKKDTFLVLFNASFNSGARTIGSAIGTFDLLVDGASIPNLTTSQQ